MIRDDLIKWLAKYDDLEDKPLVSDTIDSLIRLFKQNNCINKSCPICETQLDYDGSHAYTCPKCNSRIYMTIWVDKTFCNALQ